MTWPYAGTVYDRAPWFPVSNRFDIFKYCLASHSVMAPVVDKFVFYIDLAEFAPQQPELQAYMETIFPVDKLEVHWHRIERTKEWREVSSQFADNDLVWYEGNDDHIFIDYNLDIIKSAQAAISADPDPNSVFYYSHWPEQMRMALRLNGELAANGDLIKFDWDTVDSLLLMKGSRFKRYWLETDCGEDNIYRSDSLGWQYGFKCASTVYAPTRELIRHYDGYSHVGKLLGTVAPPLYVPQGFFDNNMQVRVGYPERRDGWQNLYAAAERLYSIDPHGVEARWCVEDIPLFWHTHITELDINLDQPTQLLQQARDCAVLAMARIPLTAHGHEFGTECLPQEYFLKNLLTNHAN